MYAWHCTKKSLYNSFLRGRFIIISMFTDEEPRLSNVPRITWLLESDTSPKSP